MPGRATSQMSRGRRYLEPSILTAGEEEADLIVMLSILIVIHIHGLVLPNNSRAGSEPLWLAKS